MSAQPIPAHELHEVLTQAHSDLYKDLYGIRPRWTRYDALSTERLGEMVVELQGRLKALLAWERLESRHEAREAARETREAQEPWMDRAAHAGAEGW